MRSRCGTAWSLLALCMICTPAAAVTYNVPPDPLPAQLVSGDILNYSGPFDVELPAPPAGAVVDVVDSHVLFDGVVRGDVNLTRSSARFFSAADAHITASGHNAGIETARLDRSRIDLFDGASLAYVDGNDSEVFISGGQMGSLGNADDWMISMISGSINEAYDPIYYSTWTNTHVNVSGGAIGHLPLGRGSTLSLAGGEFDKELSGYDVGFAALPGSSVHLFVHSAQLNGATIPGLTPGATVPLDLDEVEGELTGVLRDGSPFLFQLFADFDSQDPYMLDAVIVTAPSSWAPTQYVEVFVTRVPEPAGLVLAGIAAAVLVQAMRRR